MSRMDTRRKETETPLTNLNGEAIEYGKVRIIRRRGEKDKIYGDFTHRSHFAQVPLELIRFDPTYQRDTRSAKITTLAHRWNQDLAGVPVVSLRSDGYYYMVDGQHRISALRLMENCPKHIFCEVFSNLTPVEEAWLFRALDNERDNLTPASDYKAALASRDPVAIGVQKAVAKAGFTIDPKLGKVAGNLRNFKTLMNVYNRVGEAGLVRILTTLHQIWPHDKNATGYQMVLGMEAFYKKFPQAKDRLLIRALTESYRGKKPPTPVELIAEGMSYQKVVSSQVGQAVGLAITNAYNRGKKEERNRLMWS